ncbi:MAG: CotH kinase family protein [Spirochaetia bacterium]|nr:CotH kinase family protein [Spirochaetia bacterium]
MAENFYTPCILKKDKWRGDAVIKIRGNTSRREYKKSFGLKIDKNKYMLERGEENGGLYNRIVMRAYQLAGVPACSIESVGLFLNDSYLGCYNFITYYRENILKGELYKCRFHDSELMVNNHPLRDKSKKEYPDDGDFSSLELLIIAATKYSDSDWRQFVKKNVDIEEIASYMVVHDFFTVVDTRGANFYINYCGKYRLIPWDNERCMLKNSSAFTLCDDNKLIRQLAAVPEVKEAYNRRMQELFTGSGATCILDQLQSEAAVMFDDLATAMENDPKYCTSKSDFMKIKGYVLNYLDKDTGRAAEGDKLVLH